MTLSFLLSPADSRTGSRSRGIDWSHPGAFQHIGYPSVLQLPDGTLLASYHEWADAERPLQEVRCTRFRLRG